MLTADYDRLGLRPGDRLLDLGCGFGRHAFEALRRGARVVACDMAVPELVETLGVFEGMQASGEAPPQMLATAVNGDATRLPFADGSFDRIIASEVMEHVADDLRALDELTRVLRPGGTMAVTVPAWFPERVCWALSEEYHAPYVEGGHVRIYTEGEVRRKMQGAGLEPGGAHLAHALHSPYWWLRCAVGPTNDANPLVRAYARLLEWDIVAAPSVTRVTERLLNPVLGKSLVVYATKPVRTMAHA
ncbi:MAG: class I SAM-dependent methyltransferase [Acidimicrobiales bacterium]|jgi:SAM-dependent methyltransferase|nr:class I SAM-dependent methyltransferase [Acidimicrobiales bacterium]